jgi:hypothetical protein
VVLAVGLLLPARAFFPAPFRQVYSPRFGGILRLLYYTAALTALSLLREATGGRAVAYLWIL